MSDSFDKLDSGDNTMYLYILAVAFIYGLVHALGPGHGKMVIASYFLIKGAKTKEALKAGFLTSIIHTISALSVTMVLFSFFQNSITQYFQEINTSMYKVSAAFIILIALYLLYETIKDRNIKEQKVKEDKIKDKNIFSIAFSIGIVPCPGVMTIVLFSMILGYYYLGVLSAVMMSIGMGITISFAAILSTRVKNSKYKDIYEPIFRKITYVAIGFLLSLGFVILA
jgi:ABC-type nickel/cobalt efflux system permease component RcnA